MKVGELNRDAMEFGDPEDAWSETIKFFRRANCESGIARELRQTADAAATDADIHAVRAQGFTHLADAMERAPVFAADPPGTNEQRENLGKTPSESGGNA